MTKKALNFTNNCRFLHFFTVVKKVFLMVFNLLALLLLVIVQKVSRSVMADKDVLAK